MSTQWKPSEIIIHRKVQNDQVTRSIIEKCKGIPIEFVNGATPESVIPASEILSSSPENRFYSYHLSPVLKLIHSKWRMTEFSVHTLIVSNMQ